jgi:single-stranded-DNA-specific exonuclease
VPQKPKPDELASQNNESDTLMHGLSDEVPLDTVFVFGSMRSPANYDITAGLDRIAALRPDIFVAYGGHAQAAGFTIYPEQFETFCVLWQADIASHKKMEDPIINEASLGSLIGKPWVFDARLTLGDCTLDFVGAVEQIGPFGIGFIKPLFVVDLEKLPVIEALGSSGEHIKLVGPK